MESRWLISPPVRVRRKQSLERSNKSGYIYSFLLVTPCRSSAPATHQASAPLALELNIQSHSRCRSNAHAYTSTTIIIKHHRAIMEAKANAACSSATIPTQTRWECITRRYSQTHRSVIAPIRASFLQNKGERNQ